MYNSKSTHGSSLRTISAAFLGVILLGSTVTIADSSDHDHHDHDAEHREVGSHQHGVAELGFAVEDRKLAVEFGSPAANLVGFEHAPKTAEQKTAVAQAIAVLKGGTALFAIDEKASCALSAASVSSPFEDEEHAHDNDQHHEDDEDTHSDFSARYLFDCAAPNKMTVIEVQLFDAFPAIEKIETVFLADGIQLGVDLTKTNNALRFSPL